VLVTAPTRPVSLSQPSRPAQSAKKFVGTGLINSQDLDAVRADWYMDRARGVSCGADLSSDANGDGCVDIVDMQAELAAQGSATATSLSTAPAAPLAIGDPIAHTFVVNSPLDTPDAAPGNGVCADSSGLCTLRAAMTEADWLNGNDRITFALVGPAPVTIQLSGRLPNISSSKGTLEIDGYTEPGSSVNTAASGSNAVPGVELRGNGQSARETGFYITSAGNTIRGLLIDNVYRGIFLDGANAHDNKIIGNIIGFRKDGSNPGSGDAGVLQNYGANHNLIGTPSLADRNVIGNQRVGEDEVGIGTNNNITQNNVFCMRPNGTATATCQIGLDHNFGPKNHLIGGTGTNEKNVIGPTTLQGIELSHGWDPDTHDYNSTYEVSGNQIIGNWVGFRGDGSYNASFRSGLNFSGADNDQGINVYDGSDDNLVQDNYIASVYDGIQVGIYSKYADNNVIRHNFIGISPLGENAPMSGWGIIARGGGEHDIFDSNLISNAAKGGVGLYNANNNGVAMNPDQYIRITKNIITNTNGPAIDLYGPAGGGGAGPDPNDPGDTDQGANGRLNTPVFTSVTTTVISGTADNGASVELYQASRPAGQFGLPIVYLGTATAANNGTWSLPIHLAAGTLVTALQILPDDTTSELAANVAVTQAVNQPPEFSTDFGDRTDTEGAAISFDANASDPNADTLTYSATNLPDGIAINPNTGVVSGTLSSTSSGVYNVTLSVSDGSLSDTDTFTWTVVDAAVIVDDSFGRTTSNGWGSAPVGGAYSISGTAANFSVGSGVGQITTPSAGALRSALLNAPSVSDVDVSFSVAANKTAAGTHQFVYAVVRRNGNNEYRVKMRFDTDGNVYVGASMVINNGETNIANMVAVPGLTHPANAIIHFRAEVSGASPTTIKVRAWADGTSEPSTWNYTATNSNANLQGAGGLGLRTYLGGATSNAPVTFTFDDFLVTSMP
jgi:CSLREA domain-containing protein